MVSGEVASKLVVVVGETASGKSGLAMQIARQFDGEIINADSWNIYRHMNIGTAKPTPEDREEITHHLVDIVEPDESFTAVDFQKSAKKEIEEISKRGKLPVMVGGNGLYVDSVVFDYSFLPVGAKGEREKLSKLSLSELLQIANERGLDLTGIDQRNKRRVIRVIETDGQRPTRAAAPRENTLLIGIARSRTDMRSRIEQRVENMFAQGLVFEVKRLAERYPWSAEAMKGIGYREFEPYLQGLISKNEVKRKIVRSTLNLAKRQRSWFKKNPQIKWVNSSEEAIKLVQNFTEG